MNSSNQSQTEKAFYSFFVVMGLAIGIVGFIIAAVTAEDALVKVIYGFFAVASGGGIYAFASILDIEKKEEDAKELKQIEDELAIINSRRM